MGYYANGSGSATIKENVSFDQIKKALLEAKNGKLGFNDVQWELWENNGTNEIDFWVSDGHWDEERAFNFVNTLIPFITDGSISYRGDEDCIWRYVFDSENSKWNEENATIDYNFESYTDGQMIEELKKRGYEVTKAAIVGPTAKAPQNGGPQ